MDFAILLSQNYYPNNVKKLVSLVIDGSSISEIGFCVKVNDKIIQGLKSITSETEINAKSFPANIKYGNMESKITLTVFTTPSPSIQLYSPDAFFRVVRNHLQRNRVKIRITRSVDFKAISLDIDIKIKDIKPKDVKPNPSTSTNTIKTKEVKKTVTKKQVTSNTSKHKKRTTPVEVPWGYTRTFPGVPKELKFSFKVLKSSSKEPESEKKQTKTYNKGYPWKGSKSGGVPLSKKPKVDLDRGFM